MQRYQSELTATVCINCIQLPYQLKLLLNDTRLQPFRQVCISYNDTNRSLEVIRGLVIHRSSYYNTLQCLFIQKNAAGRMHRTHKCDYVLKIQ